MKHIKNWFKSPIHIMVALVSIAVLGLGTIAYFTDVEAAVNRFTTGNISTEVGEDTSTPVTKENIKVTNDGKLPAYIRIRVDIPSVSYSYTDEDGVHSNQQAVITLPEATDSLSYTEWMSRTSFEVEGTGYSWTKKNDGYWYLNQPLPAGGTVTFLERVTFPGLWDAENGTLNLPDGTTVDMFTIPIVSEAVQEIEGITGEGAEKAYNTFQYIANPNRS